MYLVLDFHLFILRTKYCSHDLGQLTSMAAMVKTFKTFSISDRLMSLNFVIGYTSTVKIVLPMTLSLPIASGNVKAMNSFFKSHSGKLFIAPQGIKGMKICLNGPNHMTSMAATFVNGVNFENVFLRTSCRLTLKLSM